MFSGVCLPKAPLYVRLLTVNLLISWFKRVWWPLPGGLLYVLHNQRAPPGWLVGWLVGSLTVSSSLRSTEQNLLRVAPSGFGGNSPNWRVNFICPFKAGALLDVLDLKTPACGL